MRFSQTFDSAEHTQASKKMPSQSLSAFHYEKLRIWLVFLSKVESVSIIDHFTAVA